MSDPIKSNSIFLVTNKAAKTGKIWSDTAKNRFIKQHGSIDDIPEGDAHAVPVYKDPVKPLIITSEEQKASEEQLEKHIKTLKGEVKPDENKTPSTVQPEPKGTGFYDDWID